jgi:hypothetical protein
LATLTSAKPLLQSRQRSSLQLLPKCPAQLQPELPIRLPTSLHSEPNEIEQFFIFSFCILKRLSVIQKKEKKKKNRQTKRKRPAKQKEKDQPADKTNV